MEELREKESSDWLTMEEAQKLLPFRSKTSWQKIRDEGIIEFSQSGRKIWYSKKSVLPFFFLPSPGLIKTLPEKNSHLILKLYIILLVYALVVFIFIRIRHKIRQMKQDSRSNVNMALTYLECYVLGKYHYDNKDYEKAIRFFDQKVLLTINYIMIHTYRGNTNLALRRFNEAISNYNEAIKVSDIESDVYLNRGKAYYETELFDEAKRDWIVSAKLGSETAARFLENFEDRTISKEFYIDLESQTEYDLQKWN